MRPDDASKLTRALVCDVVVTQILHKPKSRKVDTDVMLKHSVQQRSGVLGKWRPIVPSHGSD
eukprot:45135-Eustigmatos_ZCMA.PRE.1